MILYKKTIFIALFFLIAATAGMITSNWYSLFSDSKVSETIYQQLGKKLDANRNSINALKQSVESFGNGIKPGGDISENSLLHQQIKQLLRSELKSFAASISTGQDYAKAIVSAEDNEQTNENIEAYETANDIVSAALTEGRWTQQDAKDFREVFGALNNKQRNELMQTLATSIEENEISLETPGFIY